MKLETASPTENVVGVASHDLLGSLDRRLQAWRPLEINRRVRLVGKWRKGQSGTVEEIEAGNITGLAMYGVRLDHCGQLADLTRHELTGLKRNGKPEYAA
jgi:hypothetical protein